MQPPLSVRTTLPIRASFPVRHPSPSGILSRQAPSLSGTHPCQAPSLSGILSRQALIPARHPSLSGILLRQASFPVRHSSLPGIHPRQALIPARHPSPSGTLSCQAFFPSKAWTIFTTNSWHGTGTPTFAAARTTEPLMVSTSLFLPSLRSARMEVQPLGDISDVFLTLAAIASSSASSPMAWATATASFISLRVIAQACSLDAM